MNVMTVSKIKSIKQKKNSIIHSSHLQQSKYMTPSKATKQTPIKQLDTRFIHRNAANRTASIHLSMTQRKEERELPQNALMKKCFHRNRAIRSIKDLSHLYQTKILSKSKYKFKPQESSLFASMSNKSEGIFSNKKKFSDKIPKNILATEQSIIQNSVKARSKSKDSHHSFSQSKIIKDSIIRYE